MRWKEVSALGRLLPGVSEGRAFGAKAIAVRGAIVVRLLDDGKSIAVKVDLDHRRELCASDPAAFTVPPELQNYSMMAVRLPAMSPAELWPVLVGSWRRSAPASLVAAYDPPDPAPS